jgi:hypothetical protein
MAQGLRRPDPLHVAKVRLGKAAERGRKGRRRRGTGSREREKRRRRGG